MYHTMRSAFKRWLTLHNEEFRCKFGYVRIPGWFNHYIKNNTDWEYVCDDKMGDKEKEVYKKLNMSINTKRMPIGFYMFYISDEELLNLQRPKR